MKLRLYCYQLNLKSLIYFFSALPILAFSNPTDGDTTAASIDPLKKRKLIATTAIVQTGTLAGVFAGLNEAWYKQYPRTLSTLKKTSCAGNKSIKHATPGQPTSTADCLQQFGEK